MSDWTKPIVAAAVSALVAGGGGAGGTYALVNHRLSQLETRLEAADSRDQAKLWGSLIARLEAIESRTDDSALTDWNRWRATVDAKLVGIEVDIRDLRQ